MPKRDQPGVFEQLVLLAMIRLGDNAYGMTIRREIEEQTKRPIALGAVYTTLDRLESKGYISSCEGPGTPERRARARRFFRIEPEGLEALDEVLRALDRLRAGLDRITLPDRGLW
jgi:DNA-binding PadR family transcriptional regulator